MIDNCINFHLGLIYIDVIEVAILLLIHIVEYLFKIKQKM